MKVVTGASTSMQLCSERLCSNTPAEAACEGSTAAAQWMSEALGVRCRLMVDNAGESSKEGAG